MLPVKVKVVVFAIEAQFPQKKIPVTPLALLSALSHSPLWVPSVNVRDCPVGLMLIGFGALIVPEVEYPVTHETATIRSPAVDAAGKLTAPVVAVNPNEPLDAVPVPFGVICTKAIPKQALVNRQKRTTLKPDLIA